MERTLNWNLRFVLSMYHYTPSCSRVSVSGWSSVLSLWPYALHHHTFSVSKICPLLHLLPPVSTALSDWGHFQCGQMQVRDTPTLVFLINDERKKRIFDLQFRMPWFILVRLSLVHNLWFHTGVLSSGEGSRCNLLYNSYQNTLLVMSHLLGENTLPGAQM